MSNIRSNRLIQIKSNDKSLYLELNKYFFSSSVRNNEKLVTLKQLLAYQRQDYWKKVENFIRYYYYCYYFC